MGVMAFPAGELIHIVNAFLELYLNILKMVLGEGLIVAMAIHAHKLLLYSCFNRVRKSGVIVGMTIVTSKGPVDRRIKSIPVNGALRIHALMFGPACIGILDNILHFPMALQTSFVVINVVVHFVIGGF
jgi:hypothetical protein